MIMGNFQRHFTAIRLKDGVSLVLKGSGRKKPDRILVFHQEDGPFSCQISMGGLLQRFTVFFRFGCFHMARQIDTECCSLTILIILGKDEAACLFDDAVNGTKAKARALADFLGSEEGVEYLADHFFRNAGSRIRNPHQTIITRRNKFIEFLLFWPDRHIFRLECKQAVARHGVARIHREINNHLFKLPAVNLDQPEVTGVIYFQLDGLPDQSSEQV